MSNEKVTEPKRAPTFMSRLKRRLAGSKDLRESLEGVIESHAETTGGPGMPANPVNMPEVIPVVPVSSELGW